MIASGLLGSALPAERVVVPGTDLEVYISLENGELTLQVMKANTRVYRVVVEQATAPIDNAWIAEMFGRDDRVRLADLSSDVADYMATLDIAQG